MSKEEKEAIETLETLSCYGLGLVITDENIQSIDIVLDYIEKLQKENEEIIEKIKVRIEELKEEKHKIENKGTLIIDEEKGTISHEGIEGMNDVINLVVTRKEIAFFEKILNEEIK